MVREPSYLPPLREVGFIVPSRRFLRQENSREIRRFGALLLYFCNTPFPFGEELLFPFMGKSWREGQPFTRSASPRKGPGVAREAMGGSSAARRQGSPGLADPGPSGRIRLTRLCTSQEAPCLTPPRRQSGWRNPPGTPSTRSRKAPSARSPLSRQKEVLDALCEAPSLV